MSNSTTAQRRKGGAPAKVNYQKGGSTEVVHHDAVVVATASSTTTTLVDADNARMNNINPSGGALLVEDILQKEQAAVTRATVRRNFCGTGPFDKHWLNVDCCGLFCAFLTYCLHVYGVYAVCFVLIPPWMSVIVNNNNGDTDGRSTTTGEQQRQLLHHNSSHSPPPERYLTIAGQLNRFVFITMALLACVAHFKAMTTDPGAVPPDAKPLPTTETIANKEDTAANGDAEQQAAPRKQQHLRLCRRCRAFKPARAHHCSVCKRCIIKMDHHCPWCVVILSVVHSFFLLLSHFSHWLVSCLSMNLFLQGQQLCRHWQPQVLFAVHLLHLHHVCLFTGAHCGAIFILRPYPSPNRTSSCITYGGSSGLFGSTHAALDHFGSTD
jgi:DHHC palmitoyltransferase